jgi:hypothetical protein
MHVPVLHVSVSAAHCSAVVHGSPAPDPPLPPPVPVPGPVPGPAPAPWVVPLGSMVVLVAHAEAQSNAPASTAGIHRDCMVSLEGKGYLRR